MFFTEDDCGPRGEKIVCARPWAVECKGSIIQQFGCWDDFLIHLYLIRATEIEVIYEE